MVAASPRLRQAGPVNRSLTSGFAPDQSDPQGRSADHQWG